MSDNRPGPVARFDGFELDLEREELLLDGTAVSVQPQPLRMLVLLVAQAGKLVTRERIQKFLWPGSDAGDLDVDRSLNHTVRKLRQALGDDARLPRYVQTVPRRGYRFVADVSRGQGDPSRSSTSKTTAAGTGGVLLLPSQLPPASVRLRISGFREVTDDRSWPSLADGVVEELITHLVQLRHTGLAVLDNTFRGDGDAPKPFFGLTGCVRRSGAKVRVHVHLSQHPEGDLVRSTVFEQELGNVFDLQGAASRHIVAELILPLLESVADSAPAPASSGP